MHQHTGNWSGKTVSNASGITRFNNTNFLLVDIPGTYSLMSNSEEEEIARNYICFENADATIIVVDATCLERNLNLVYQTMEITNKLIICVNLLDEAEKKGISINLKLLEKKLGVPVIGTIAKKKKTLNNLMKKVLDVCEGRISPIPNNVKYNDLIENCIKLLEPNIKDNLSPQNKYLSRWVSIKLLDNDKKIVDSIEKNLLSSYLTDTSLENNLNKCNNLLLETNFGKENFKDEIVSTILFKAEDVTSSVRTIKNCSYSKRDRKIPIMIMFLAAIFWLTIVGANYPSSLLSELFGYIQIKLVACLDYLSSPMWLTSILLDGVYCTLTWVISVMLPPLAIFFPLFTLIEDLGYLPRIAFNLDKYFKKACSSRKTCSYNLYAVLVVMHVV